MMPDAVYLLASVMMGEGGALGEQGMLAVGHVIMNRVTSDEFPDFVTEVIEQRRQFNGRGEPGWFHMTLARRVLRRERDPTGGMLYTLSEQDRRKLGFPNGDKVVEHSNLIKLHLYKEWPGG